MNKSKSYLMLAFAVVAGAGAALTSAIADDPIVTMCYRGQTIQVPSYLVARYIGKGAVSGPCDVTPG